MTVVEALLVGAVIGAVLGLVGAGGAILAVPAFLYIFGFGALEATTASLAVVAASAASGAIPRFRQHQVDVRHALIFWLVGIPGTFVGSRLSTIIAPGVLLMGFALVMLAAAVAMWRKSSAVPSDDHRDAPKWLLVLVALGIGLMTGLFGVGGGFLIVPALVLVFSFPFGMAAGTSLVVIALNSVTALIFKYDTWASIEWQVPILVVVGGVVGSVVASRFSAHVPQRPLERAFAGLLVLLAVWMVVDSTLLGSAGDVESSGQPVPAGISEQRAAGPT